MDDKFLKLEIGWELIGQHSEAELTEYIVRHMQGLGDQKPD